MLFGGSELKLVENAFDSIGSIASPSIEKLFMAQLSSLPLSINVQSKFIEDAWSKDRTMSFARIIGGSTSLTVTLCTFENVWPLSVSVTVQVTAVTPTGNSEGALLVGVLVPHETWPIAVPSDKSTFKIPHDPAVASTFILAGRVIPGKGVI